MSARRLYMIGVGMLLISMQALPQASFRFRTYDSRAGVDGPVYDWNGQLLRGSNWRGELYGGSAPDSLSPLVDFYDQYRVILPLRWPGYFFENPGSGVLSALQAPCGGSAWLQVRVWDVGLGETYEAASARSLGGYGESNIFYARGGNPCLPIASEPGRLLGLESFSVRQIIPEPSVAALLMLGLSGLALDRRREGCGSRS